ncbi:hypothetical protein DPSP01_001039 [Paraphaeosphaeria sporulosa]
MKCDELDAIDPQDYSPSSTIARSTPQSIAEPRHDPPAPPALPIPRFYATSIVEAQYSQYFHCYRRYFAVLDTNNLSQPCPATLLALFSFRLYRNEQATRRFPRCATCVHLCADGRPTLDDVEKNAKHIPRQLVAGGSFYG